MAYLIWAAAVFLGLLPVAQHLIFGYRERRREILDYFGDGSVKLYFERFFAARVHQLNQRPREQLAKLYDDRFGRRTYVLPLLIYVIMLAVCVAAIVSAAVEPIFCVPLPKDTPTLKNLLESVAYALGGAYMWVVYDLLDRMRLRNIPPSALSSGAFRFLIGIPLALALFGAMPAAVTPAPAYAFLLGVFPTATLMLILRRKAASYFGLGDDAAAPKSELESLDGINTSIAEKLSEVGVTTILQLAYEDPIQLSMRLNHSFSYILDIVGQALVAIYFSGNGFADCLVPRRFGLRSAIEVADLYDGYNAKNAAQKAQAETIIKDIADALKLDVPTVANIVSEIAEDPATELLANLWVTDSSK
jgi:hypothetical protein